MNNTKLSFSITRDYSQPEPKYWVGKGTGHIYMKIPDGYILIAQGCSDPIMCVGSVYNRVDLEPNLEPFYGEITIRVKQ